MKTYRVSFRNEDSQSLHWIDVIAPTRGSAESRVQLLNPGLQIQKVERVS